MLLCTCKTTARMLLKYSSRDARAPAMRMCVCVCATQVRRVRQIQVTGYDRVDTTPQAGHHTAAPPPAPPPSKVYERTLNNAYQPATRDRTIF